MERKLAGLVAQRRYSQAIRVRGQALRRRPDLHLKPEEPELWCLEARQAVLEGQPKRAETALGQAMELGLHGEPEYLLARLWLDQGEPERGLKLLEGAFDAGTLPVEYSGAYLKLLLIQGEVAKVRERIRQHPKRFQPQQRHWAAGVLSLLEGDATNAKRQFGQMAGPASPADHGAIWRAWVSLDLGDEKAAATALRGNANAACVAVALHLAARSGQRPGELLELERGDLPRRELALALELLHHLRQRNLLPAARLFLAHQRPLLAAVPELEPLRRPLLLLAGQQALEREAPNEAIQCWRPIVEQPIFDPDLALRLYPLLDQADDQGHTEEAERLASLLQGWVRRAARESPATWPEPLLSTTLARLLCWQADQLILLGARQQVRRCVNQAQQLAPDLADVKGRRGMVAYLSGDVSTAIPLLWQALEQGCPCRYVYEILDAALEASGQEAERPRLRREYGGRFGIPEQPDVAEEPAPAWLAAVSHADVSGMAGVLLETPSTDPPLEALRILVDHISLPRPSRAAAGSGSAASPPRKKNLETAEASLRWDGLLDPLPAAQRVEPLVAILVGILRFCSRTSKTTRLQIETRLAQLEALAAEVGTLHAARAAQALLLLAGLRFKDPDDLEAESRRLLRRAHQPERLVARALLDLRLLVPTRPWRAIVEDLLERDSQNGLLVLALATTQRPYSFTYNRLSEQAFDLARRQQDREALAACRQEEWWQVECHERKLTLQRAEILQESPEWRTVRDQLDLRAMVRRLMSDQGLPPLSDAQVDAILPEFERTLARSYSEMQAKGLALDHLESEPIEEARGEQGQEDNREPRRRARRRSFMDL
ncbi:MAG: hypothetical protein EA413_06900 [Cyanobium sp. PLM2.Bin73]|nr:MAG: hypothetical protein EA413_06900 [Cyanobium sp. PLM2.Bin73]